MAKKLDILIFVSLCEKHCRTFAKRASDDLATYMYRRVEVTIHYIVGSMLRATQMNIEHGRL